ncbi:Ulp1 family isopeptidase [Candidatus Tisiphia endosymbiont of Micropterix aruncella]|uniref:Ulp1 family isopeptidase n=1 Tax=Candidatus Tisiphia endosymbiont of Micropterix aruncella TaxID=3066271 RepID=UPI003AA9BC6E
MIVIRYDDFGVRMAKTGKKENKVRLFNINGHVGQETQQNIIVANFDLNIPTRELKYNIQNGKLNKDNIISEILHEVKQGETPILNIQYNSNMEKPIIDTNDLAALKKSGVQTCFTFGNYNAYNQTLPYYNYWPPLLAQTNHVFFANANDQIRAVAEKHVAQEKTSHIQSMQVSNLIESEILKRPPNILVSGKLPNKERLTEVMFAAKELGKNTRVIVASNPSSVDDMASIIATKFGINDQNQQLGIKLEVEEILKDKIGGAKKLENYISQLSQQFQKDLNIAEINPVDIYFDLSDPLRLQNIAKQAKYTITQGGSVENLTNGCIPLAQGHGKRADIVAEVKQREAVPGINSLTIKDMQENLNEYKQENAKRITNTLQQVADERGVSTRQNEVEHSLPEGSKLTKLDYLYDEDDIGNVLKASVDQTKVSIITHASIGEESLLKETLYKAVYSDLIVDNKEAVIIPLNTGHEHWVSLAITKDNEGGIVFTYNDPMGTDIDTRVDLVDMVKKVCPDAKIVDLHTEQQQNDKDCGAFVVDNLIKMAKGEAILTTEESKNIGTTLRQAHAKTMDLEKAKQKVNTIRKSMNTYPSRPTTSPPVIRNNSRPREVSPIR